MTWKFHQNLRAGNFKTNFWVEKKWPVTLLLSELFFYQCIARPNRKLMGLARALNVILVRLYNFAGFTSMPKRNFPWDGQLYLRTFIFWDGHTNVYHYHWLQPYHNTISSAWPSRILTWHRMKQEAWLLLAWFDIALVNKLVSLTRLLWALRSVRKFTLHCNKWHCVMFFICATL